MMAPVPGGRNMLKRLAPYLTIFLLAASTAHAQSGGGHGHGNRGDGAPSSSSPTAAPAPAAIPRQTPANQIEIVGVVREIAPDSGRVTIAYEAVDALSWPAGTMPFAVSKPSLLKGVSVGAKVRFKLDSQQISDLKPF